LDVQACILNPAEELFSVIWCLIEKKIEKEVRKKLDVGEMLSSQMVGMVR
jgi:hypothetical protein